MFHSILVPLDGSSFAEQAIPLAAGIAERTLATLSLVVVHPFGPAEDAPRPGSAADRELRESEGVYLNRLMQTVGSTYRIPVCEALLDGAATGRTLVEYASQRSIDLVVASTHEHGLVGHFLSSGVARRLAHWLGPSLLLVKPQVRPVPVTARGGFDRILVALDGSEQAEAALQPAMALSSSQEPELTLMGVISGKGGTLVQRRAQAETYFEELVPQLQHRGCRVESVVLFANNPAAAIARYAKEEGFELVALTTRPRGPAARVLFGSTADAVIRKAIMPVLVCHAGRAESLPILSEDSLVVGSP
jgi:nucleotide-binding universal stress UspA family protein